MSTVGRIKLAIVAMAALLLSGCAAVAPDQLHLVRYADVGTGDAPVRLAYREQGQGDPVLLIHGFGANTYTWRHLEPVLTDTHRVIALDLKGFGHSDKPLDKRYSVADQAALVSQFIEQKKLRNLTLVGHSLGGGIALLLALEEADQRRKRIKRLVLIDSVAYEQQIPLAFNLLSAPVIGPVSNFLVPKELQARAALRIAYHDNSKFDRHDVAEYAAPLRDKGSQHAMIHSARQILPENIRELSARYPSIHVPTLIIWCDHDKVIRPHIGWRLHQDLPNSTFRLIQGCGHIPHEERPGETTEALLAFLGIAPTGAGQ